MKRIEVFSEIFENTDIFKPSAAIKNSFGWFYIRQQFITAIFFSIFNTRKSDPDMFRYEFNASRINFQA